MICIGNTRVAHVYAGNHRIVKAFHGSNDKFDYLPYLFAAPKEMIFSANPEYFAQAFVEANIDWENIISNS